MVDGGPYASLRGWMICTPPPQAIDPIERWVKQQALCSRFKTDEIAQREACYASAMIEWKLGGEKGPAPEKELLPLPRAPAPVR